MAPFNYLGQDARSEMQPNFLGHMMSNAMPSASCDANIIVNTTIALLRSRWLNCSATWLCHVTSLAPGSHDTDGTVNSSMAFLVSRWSRWGATYLFSHVVPLMPESVSFDANGIIAFLRSTWQQWGPTWPFLPCHASGTGVGITWCYQHSQCQHYIH